MRHAPTKAEGRIWRWLRARRFGGHKFRRQFPIGGYILDFYCPELRLAIELDGRHHDAEWMVDYQMNRRRELTRHGIEVVRIPNELLIRDAQSVEECIKAVIERRMNIAV